MFLYVSFYFLIYYLFFLQLLIFLPLIFPFFLIPFYLVLITLSFTNFSQSLYSPYSFIVILFFGYKFLISLCIRVLIVIGCFSISTKFYFSFTCLVFSGSKLTLKGKYSS